MAEDIGQVITTDLYGPEGTKIGTAELDAQNHILLTIDNDNMMGYYRKSFIWALSDGITIITHDVKLTSIKKES